LFEVLAVPDALLLRYVLSEVLILLLLEAIALVRRVEQGLRVDWRVFPDRAELLILVGELKVVGLRLQRHVVLRHKRPILDLKVVRVYASLRRLRLAYGIAR